MEIIPEIRKLKNPRNKAIFLTLLLSQEEVISKIGKQESLSLGKEAIDLWNITLTDDKKWNSFKKTFYLYDDISTNEDLIEKSSKKCLIRYLQIYF
ncbi:hypothetical protein H6769_08045 [Candidatus Peribacteria bacterium]|nr:hypothetical protein [Candidatus Peribacteria bacterium]